MKGLQQAMVLQFSLLARSIPQRTFIADFRSFPLVTKVDGFTPVCIRQSSICNSHITISDKIPYISEVLQMDDETPLFRVYPENNPSEVFEAGSSTGAWKKVLLAIATNQRERGEREIGTGVSGKVKCIKCDL